MELKTLRYFCVLAEELHFGRAASRLHISQPPLSRQISNLEDELGIVLFDRSQRRVELTPAGELFLRHSHTVLNGVKDAVHAVRQAGRGEIGHLSIGFFLGATYTLMPDILGSFRAHSPNVRLRLQDMGLPEVPEALIQGSIDVGFLRPPITHQAISTELLLREPVVAALPETHRFARSRRLKLADLADEAFVTFTPSRSVLYSQIMSACHDAGFQPYVVQEIRRPETIIGLVSAGVGIALVAASAQTCAGKGVVFKKVSGLPMAEIAVAWRRSDESPLLKSFLRTARHAMKGPR